MIDLESVTNQTLSLKKIRINDLIKEYPKGVTISGVVPYRYKDKKTQQLVDDYGCLFEEEEETYFPATGGDLKKLVEGWFTRGDMDAVNEYLAHRHLRVRIEKITKQDGNPYTKVYKLGWKDIIPKAKFAPATVTDKNGVEVDTETGEVISGTVENCGENSDILPF